MYKRFSSLFVWQVSHLKIISKRVKRPVNKVIRADSHDATVTSTKLFLMWTLLLLISMQPIFIKTNKVFFDRSRQYEVCQGLPTGSYCRTGGRVSGCYRGGLHGCLSRECSATNCFWCKHAWLFTWMACVVILRWSVVFFDVEPSMTYPVTLLECILVDKMCINTRTYCQLSFSYTFKAYPHVARMTAKNLFLMWTVFVIDIKWTNSEMKLLLLSHHVKHVSVHYRTFNQTLALKHVSSLSLLLFL